MSQRRWGRTRCRKFLVQNEISEVKQVGSLTDRQRNMLASKLARCDTDALPVQPSLEARLEPHIETPVMTPIHPSTAPSVEVDESAELELVGV
jgi:hypothetical protein